MTESRVFLSERIIKDSCDDCPFNEATELTVDCTGTYEIHPNPRFDEIDQSQFDLVAGLMRRAGHETIADFELSDACASGPRRKYLLFGKMVCGSENLTGPKLGNQIAARINEFADDLAERGQIERVKASTGSDYGYEPSTNFAAKSYEIGASLIRKLIR